MRYFQQIAAGVDTMPMLLALQRRPELWNADPFRTTYPGTPHSEVDDILLRYTGPSADRSVDTVIEDDKPVWLPAARLLPWRPIVLDLMRRVAAYQLDRLLITRLRPGARIAPHADNVGEYAAHNDERARFHVALLGLPGSLYHNGDETVAMLTGSVWTFTPREVHAVENNSADDRIHLIVDVCLAP
jgi:Aspartyl/Asparaginyl beta-hydroxylase